MWQTGRGSPGEGDSESYGAERFQEHERPSRGVARRIRSQPSYPTLAERNPPLTVWSTAGAQEAPARRTAPPERCPGALKKREKERPGGR
ncbi:hypothetical protein GCM10010394_41070 [Streptomyces crystallinus]|uniref:Uncharacterized protein n=1 Tax=Streptomyces crystallinus TaxID=68191 RepID=A0ABN1G9S3_9ACTN